MLMLIDWNKSLGTRKPRTRLRRLMGNLRRLSRDSSQEFSDDFEIATSTNLQMMPGMFVYGKAVLVHIIA
jgi:hypothetical protein